MVFGKIFSKIKSSFDKTVAGLEKTRASLGRKLSLLFTIGRKIDEDFLAELEETLILSDIGVSTTERLIEDLKAKYRDKTIENPDEILNFLKKDLSELLGNEQRGLTMAPSGPTVILIVGVNGAGKTTSIAKLARLLKNQGRSVLLAAGDTFRAAAADQLTDRKSVV